MTDIGSSMAGFETTGLERGLRGENAQLAPGDSLRQDTTVLGLSSVDASPVPQRNKPVSHRRHSLWESLTASLELACRGYLCMQIVDCDSVSDPECGPSGKKVVVREIPGLQGSSAKHD